MAQDRAIEEFSDEASFEEWLAANHDSSPGIWLRIAKKGTGIPSVTYDEALQVALRWGWIDGQKRPQDEQYWLQGFGRRKARSPWSKRNREFAEKLIAGGRMQPSGLAEVESARADGRWDRAYDSARAAELPQDFLDAVRQNPDAERALEQLNRTNRYAIFYRIQDAKRPETRERRIRTFVDMLARGEKLS